MKKKQKSPRISKNFAKHQSKSLKSVANREFPELTLIQESFIKHFRTGMSVIEILSILNISKSTLYNWKKSIPSFTERMEDASDFYYDSLELNTIFISNKSFQILERVFSGFFPPEKKLEAANLALSFFKATNGLPNKPYGIERENCSIMEYEAKKLYEILMQRKKFILEQNYSKEESSHSEEEEQNSE